MLIRELLANCDRIQNIDVDLTLQRKRKSLIWKSTKNFNKITPQVQKSQKQHLQFHWS